MVAQTKTKQELDETITKFLSQQKKSTAHIYQSMFKHILNFTGLNGKAILESKKADKEFYWETQAISLRQYVKSLGLSDNSADTSITALRSFFDYYRTPLVFSQSETRKLNGRARRTTQDYMLTNEDLAKLALVGNLKEKYIVLLGKSFGLRAGDFVSLTYGDFRSINLDGEAPIFLGDIQTEKEMITAHPFIDSDALPIVKAVLDSNRNKPNNERIITFHEKELSPVLQNLATKANINLGGKHLRFHCFRKYLIDRLSPNMSESKWKQIIGKSISEDAYVSSFELKESYAKAMKLTTIYTNGNGKVSRLNDDVIKLQKENQILKDRLDKIETLVNPSQPHDEEEDKQLDEDNERIIEQIEAQEKYGREHPQEAKRQERKQEDKDYEEYIKFEEMLAKNPEIRRLMDEEEAKAREQDEKFINAYHEMQSERYEKLMKELQEIFRKQTTQDD